jgi:RND family efflux transporter MFP subunit
MTPKKIARLVLVGILLVVIVVFVIRFMTLRGQTPASSIDEIQAAEGFPVDVQIIEKGAIARYLDVIGNVQGIEQVDLKSSLPIDVTGILKREGQTVKKGEVVIQLARDRRGNAFHQYTTARQALENAKSDLERMENLYKEGAVSGQMLEQARLAYENASSQYNEAASMVDLISPINGVVTLVNATVGSTAMPGVPLATVATIDKVRIRCFVGQEEVVQLRVGQKALIKTSVGAVSPQKDANALEGTVNKVAISADPETMLFLIEITADNSAGLLRPGVVASLSILIEEKKDVVTVPVTALVSRGEGIFVYLIDEGRAHLRDVTLGIDDGEFIELTDGATVGDTLVFRGQYRLADNVPVKIRRIEGND